MKRLSILALAALMVLRHIVVGIQPMRQDAPDECIGCYISHPRIESWAIENIDAVTCKRIKLLAKPHQSRWWLRPGEEFSWCRFEAHYDRR